jgi:hypothetical protein
MKIITIIVLIFLYSCTNTQRNPEEGEIKKTVANFWKSVDENNLNEYTKMIYDSENYPGVTSSELFFLHKHRDLINKQQRLKNIKIKDTIGFVPNVKLKYVQYKYFKDSNKSKEPLIITLMFYESIGLNKIYNPVILQNHIGWDK